MLAKVQRERELQQTIEDLAEIYNNLIGKQKYSVFQGIGIKETLQQQLEIQKQEVKKAKKQETKEQPQTVTKVEEKSKPKVKLAKSQVVKAGKKVMIATSAMKKKPQKQQEKPKEEEKKQDESEEEMESEQNKKEEIVVIKIKDIEDAMMKEFEERYRGNALSIKIICEAVGVPFQEDNLNECTNISFQECKKILYSFKKSSQDDIQINFESPYLKISQKMLEKCIFLLRISNKQTIDQSKSDSLFSEKASINSGDTRLTPVGMNRSISMPLNEKNIDKQKLKVFRNWIESYSNWKSYIKDAAEQNDDVLYQTDCSPMKSIISFLSSDIDPVELFKSLEQQNIRCAKLVVGNNLLNMLYTEKLVQEDISSSLQSHCTNLLRRLFWRNTLLGCQMISLK